MLPHVETGVDRSTLDRLVEVMHSTPEGFHVHPKRQKQLADRLKLPADVAGQAFDATLKGFQADGALDMTGVRNVLKLRAQFEGGTPADPAKYIDLSYYEKARAGL